MEQGNDETKTRTVDYLHVRHRQEWSSGRQMKQTRRDFLKSAAGLTLAGAGSIAAVETKRSGSARRPAISGTLWWVSPQQSTRWGETGWERELEEQKQLGFDLLWLTNAPSILGHPVCALPAHAAGGMSKSPRWNVRASRNMSGAMAESTTRRRKASRGGRFLCPGGGWI